jgi:hypothetical protein
MEVAILEHTARVQAALAETFRGSPVEEIQALLKIAQRREAMVVAMYSRPSTLERTRNLSPEQDRTRELREAIATAILGIWVHESSHTEYIESLRSIAEAGGGGWQSLVGDLEGKITSWATRAGASGVVARWLTGLGRAVGAAPTFTAELAPLSFLEFCRFSVVLERTAADGYTRIIELLSALEPARQARAFAPATLYDMARIRADEAFHTAVFGRISDWLQPDGETLIDGLTADACARELHALAKLHLEVTALRELPARVREVLGSSRAPNRGREHSGPWVSDGGLDRLFRRYKLPWQVVSRTDLRDALSSRG